MYKMLIPSMLLFSLPSFASKVRENIIFAIDTSAVEVFGGAGFIEAFLLSKGVITDAHSSVSISEESNNISLECFNCIIIHSEDNNYNESPFNEFDRRF